MHIFRLLVARIKICQIAYVSFEMQHDLTPRIVLHKITIALNFMSYIKSKVAAKLLNRNKFMPYIN